MMVATSLKFYQTMDSRRSEHEAFYIHALSIQDALASTICRNDQLEYEGEFNSYIFSAQCQLMQNIRHYKVGVDVDDISGNIGHLMLKLYLVDLEITNERNVSKHYPYYITRYEPWDVAFRLWRCS